ncbi:Transcriptional activator of fatty acid utilization [Mortierella sp. NVP41]|nr:Transcriptional activator of fatty acid utilization [Mortierella sp. NVP41]
MALPTSAIKPKKKRTAVVLGCDQCRRRKTKCDQARPTCGPCLYAGLMECTFLLGKTPASKRKKPHSEVEILEARLETIESRYSERLSQMESLLSKVMPSPDGQDSNSTGNSEGSLSSTSQPVNRAMKGPGINTSNLPLDMVSGTDDGWADITSPQEPTLQIETQWDRDFTSPSMALDSMGTPTLTTTMGGDPTTPRTPFLKEESQNYPLFTPEFQSSISVKSPASSIAPSFTSTADQMQEDSGGDDEGDLSELAATMDKLRVFDASVYFGKGSMLFTSTDQEKFWDEEISFDVHEARGVDIPPEATVLPPVEVMDSLFDIYYQHYYVYLPMIQKTTLLQALEDRFEPQSIFLLNSVFMAAALTGDCVHPCCWTDPTDQKTLGTPFFERARMVLDFCIGIPRLSTVQGLIMLSRYPRISGLGHSYMQQAILMGMDLGLHRKCDRWIPDKQVQESRKRVFWCVYAADSSTSTVTGRRPMIDDAEIDVPMIVPTEGDTESETVQLLFLVQTCRLWRIFRNIKRFIFNAVEVQDMVPGSLPKSYEQQLIQWQLQLPAALRFTFDIKADDPRAMQNSRAGIVQMLYESALILLHKPYLSSSEHLKRSPYRSQDICIKAATKITEIAKVLAQTYYKAFELTSVGEYSMLNAVRIHVMFLKSADAKVAETAQTHFDYIMRFFREFYSSPRANCDEQSINCVLSFFEEFMHTVKGLSQSSVHVCAGAIKSLAIAKRNRIPSGKAGAAGAGGGRGQTHAADQRNMSRLVKIGRQERAKARSQSTVSPSPLTRDASGLQRKRLSHLQHEGQQRLNPNLYFQNQQQQQQQHLTQQQIQQLQQQQQQRQGSIAPSNLALTGLQDTSPTLSRTSGYYNPGKLQKVSQYIGPFGGPQVMESLKQYQTATAILNQPPVATSTILQTTNIQSRTGDLFPTFGQQAMTMTTLQQQQQQLQAQQQAQQQTQQQAQQQQQQQQQNQQFNLNDNNNGQQQQQQFYNQLGQQPVALYDPNFNQNFWGDMNNVSGTNTTGLFADSSQLLSPGHNASNLNSLSPAGSVATTSTTNNTAHASTNTNNNTNTNSGNNSNNSNILNGFIGNNTNNSSNSNNSNMYNSSGFDAVSQQQQQLQQQFLQQQQQQQQQQQAQQQLSAVDTSGFFMPLKVEPIETTGPLLGAGVGVGSGAGAGAGAMDEELSADQVQALLEQTIAAANTRNNTNNSNNLQYNPHQQQHQQQHHQQMFQQHQTFRQQMVSNPSLELSGVQEDFHTTNWPGMM